MLFHVINIEKTLINFCHFTKNKQRKYKVVKLVWLCSCLSGEMEQDQREQADLEKQIKALMTDMVKLNSLLSKNSDLNQALQQSNSLMETEFRQSLKVQHYAL